MIKFIKPEPHHIAELTELGRTTVYQAHKTAAPPKDMTAYLDDNYVEDVIRLELNDPNNIYYLMYDDDRMIGFSKIVYNSPNKFLPDENVTKLDRIYLMEEYHGKGLAQQFLDFNIELAKENGQSALWLYTWVGNKRAIAFYEKEGFETIGEHMFQVSATHSNPNHVMCIKF